MLDLYVYHGLRGLLHCNREKGKSIFFWIYWVVSIGLLAGILISIKQYTESPDDLSLFNKIMKYNGIYIIFMSFKLVFAIFTFISDAYRLLSGWFTTKPKRSKERFRGKRISRADFIKKTGAVLSMLPVLGLIHGIGWGRYNFTLHHKKIRIKNLPDSFEGFKIVQLSDAHLGSFAGQQDRIREVVEQINELNPDIMVFTGDMVNNFSHEMSGWVPVWKEIKAKLGKFSVLGNHDYGTYSVWPNENAQKKNLLETMRQEKEMGFDLLMNENREIKIGNESIFVAGVENWGKPPFPQHGRLDKALSDIPEGKVIVLLSHDPDHFEEEILGKTTVNLTLSGHTHGFQFGIEIGNFKMSPGRLKYKRWADLYQEGDQYLYVNRGLGYLLFPVRVGIWPEISLLELHKA